MPLRASDCIPHQVSEEARGGRHPVCDGLPQARGQGGTIALDFIGVHVNARERCECSGLALMEV